jgi:hypothetical protein
MREGKTSLYYEREKKTWLEQLPLITMQSETLN